MYTFCILHTASLIKRTAAKQSSSNMASPTKIREKNYDAIEAGLALVGSGVSVRQAAKQVQVPIFFL